MTQVVELDTRDLSVTPFFDVRSLENVQKSEAAGYMVKEQIEVVQVRIAGSTNFSPVFPTNAMWKREGNRTITYAERWPEEYQRFKNGEAQEARGTPLEMLATYGVTPEQISICRVMRIYSIEQLHQLEGPNVKSLVMQANALKDAARKFMADRMSGSEASARILELEAKLAALEGRSTVVPAVDPIEAQMTARPSGDDYDDMKNPELLALLIARTGTAPAEAKPPRAWMIATLRELDGAK
jgi:hypothetical protein